MCPPLSSFFSIERALITQLERAHSFSAREQLDKRSTFVLFLLILIITNYKFSLLRFRRDRIYFDLDREYSYSKRLSIDARVTPKVKRRIVRNRKESNRRRSNLFNAEDRKRDEIFSGRRDRRHCGFPFIAVPPS